MVFADHGEIPAGAAPALPDAAHVLGRDDAHARADAVARFQCPDGPRMIVCSLRAASQGITLTRASNVPSSSSVWTPARHDQAEDRCHRIGRENAVTAWYLLAPETIDETMATLLQRKRGIIDAITDGRVQDGEALVEAVVRDLRARPFRHLRAVA